MRSSLAAAQSAALPPSAERIEGALRESAQSWLRPSAVDESQPLVDFILPPLAPPHTDAESLNDRERVFVRDIKFIGNTAFSTADLAKVADPYRHRSISFVELEALRYAITAYYIDNGYISSGAIVPDQAVENGVIVIQIIEGRLSDIEVLGARWLRPQTLRDQLWMFAEAPLRLSRLQEGLQLLQGNPLIHRIRAELRPTLVRGEGVLRVTVEEASPYRLGLAFDNHQSPSVGSERGVLSLQHGSVLGRGDALSFRFAATSGVRDYDAGYILPLNGRATSLAFDFRRVEASVVEAPFDRLDIKSATDSYALTLQHPFYRRAAQELSVALSLEYRSSDTFLLGRRFSFSSGTADGRSVVAPLRAVQQWFARSSREVLAARSAFSFGLPAFGATENSGGVADARFFAWLGQFQWARRLGAFDAESIVRGDVQLTPDRLLPVEQFTVGGSQSVRGYRENQLVRDNGAVASLELRIPVWHGSGGFGAVQVAPFTDIGGAWAAHGTTPEPSLLASVGVGLRWAVYAGLDLQIYWGKALLDAGPSGDDPQDYGLHFALGSDFGPSELIGAALLPFRETQPITR